MFPLGNEASEPSGLLNKVFNSTRPCSFPFGKFCVEVLSGDHMAATAIAPSSTQMLVTGSSYAATVTTCFDNGVSSGCGPNNCTLSFAGSLSSSTLAGTYTATPNQPCTGRTGSVNTTKQ